MPKFIVCHARRRNWRNAHVVLAAARPRASAESRRAGVAAREKLRKAARAKRLRCFTIDAETMADAMETAKECSRVKPKRF